ncbi:hypothetical protein KIN20_010154 [Parelaphostrongylus tenuis]|uniref:Uncharacterized protein n=1 Tax=Parelaphostrongylus tenuis TaxID=148309 RepID=A0AAD5MRI4_PARTN|nr:hypothetical protein KIN20_010154 [Parelaphostrongylus tenuis]
MASNDFNATSARSAQENCDGKTDGPRPWRGNGIAEDRGPQAENVQTARAAPTCHQTQQSVRSPDIIRMVF